MEHYIKLLKEEWTFLQIAHDYIPNQQRKIFVEVRDKYAELKSTIHQTRSFLKQTGWLSV